MKVERILDYRKLRFYPFVLLNQVMLQMADIKRLLDTLDILPIGLDLLFRNDPNAWFCFQGLFQVLPKEDAGVV